MYVLWNSTSNVNMKTGSKYKENNKKNFKSLLKPAIQCSTGILNSSFFQLSERLCTTSKTDSSTGNLGFSSLFFFVRSLKAKRKF